MKNTTFNERARARKASSVSMCCCCEVMHIRCWKTSSFRVYDEEMREKGKNFMFRRWFRAHETSSSFCELLLTYFGEKQHHQQQQHQQQRSWRRGKKNRIEFFFWEKKTKKEIKKKPQRKHEKSLKWEKETFVIWELFKNKEKLLLKKPLGIQLLRDVSGVSIISKEISRVNFKIIFKCNFVFYQKVFLMNFE